MTVVVSTGISIFDGTNKPPLVLLCGGMFQVMICVQRHAKNNIILTYNGDILYRVYSTT